MASAYSISILVYSIYEQIMTFQINIYLIVNNLKPDKINQKVNESSHIEITSWFKGFNLLNFNSLVMIHDKPGFLH